MRKQVLATLVMGSGPLLVAGLTAQQPAGAGSTSNAGQPMTVTGCIERADQVSTRGNSADVDSLDFMLIKVQQGSRDDQPTGTAGSPSVPGRPQVSGVGAMYRLRGQVNEINPHVGHQVEITGTVTSPTDAAGATGTAAGGTATTGSPAATAPVTASSVQPAPVLTITRMTLISETCPRSER